MRFLLIIFVFLASAAVAVASPPPVVCPVCSLPADESGPWCRGCSWPLAEIRAAHRAWLRESSPADRGETGESFRHLPGPGEETVSVALVERGWLALQQKQWQATENFARAALRRNPWYPGAFRLLAHLALATDRREDAARHFTRLLQISPRNSEARDFFRRTPGR